MLPTKISNHPSKCVAPQWRNGQRIRLLIWGLRGRVPPGVLVFVTPRHCKKKKQKEASTEQRWQHVRVVKESDLKSDGLCPRRFKSCCCRVFDFDVVVAIKFACLLAVGALYPWKFGQVAKVLAFQVSGLCPQGFESSRCRSDSSSSSSSSSFKKIRDFKKTDFCI